MRLAGNVDGRKTDVPRQAENQIQAPDQKEPTTENDLVAALWNWREQVARKPVSQLWRRWHGEQEPPHQYRVLISHQNEKVRWLSVPVVDPQPLVKAITAVRRDLGKTEPSGSEQEVQPQPRWFVLALWSAPLLPIAVTLWLRHTYWLWILPIAALVPYALIGVAAIGVLTTQRSDPNLARANTTVGYVTGHKDLATGRAFSTFLHDIKIATSGPTAIVSPDAGDRCPLPIGTPVAAHPAFDSISGAGKYATYTFYSHGRHDGELFALAIASHQINHRRTPNHTAIDHTRKRRELLKNSTYPARS